MNSFSTAFSPESRPRKRIEGEISSPYFNCLIWTKDKKRREKADVPKEVRYRTRHQFCLEMLKQHGKTLPHAWVAGDDEMGRPYWFRRPLFRHRYSG